MTDVQAMPRVSLVIMSYNQDAYIADAIAGAIAQDYANLEIIVTDDGSSDGTPQIIAEWASRHPGKITPVLSAVNSGISKNCNRGLARCSGEFVSFVGGDDVLLPSKISEQVAWFQVCPDAVLCGHRVDILIDGVVVKADAAYTNFGRGAGPEQFISEGMQLHGASLMARASAMPSFGFDESIPMGSDLMFCIDVLSGGGQYGFVDQVLANYRIHGGNISTQNIDTLLKDYEQTYLQAARRYPRLNHMCQSAITRHVHYYGAVKKLSAGDVMAAKAGLRKAIARNPLYARAWVRLAQAFLKGRS